MPFRSFEVSDPALAPAGLRFLTVKSVALGQRADLTLFVPAQASGARQLPLCVLLHGVGVDQIKFKWKTMIRVGHGNERIPQHQHGNAQSAGSLLLGYAAHQGRDLDHVSAHFGERFIGHLLPV